MDLALNNLQRLICHKPNQPSIYLSIVIEIMYLQKVTFKISSICMHVFVYRYTAPI